MLIFTKIKIKLFKFNFKNFFTHKTILKEVYKFDLIIPPSSWYTNEDFFQLEKQKVFKKNWLGVCGYNKLTEHGNFNTGEIVDQQYVIVNTTEGEKSSLKAYYNACSHKAAQVASGSGSCNEFVCPYHGWTYNLKGNLTKATSLGGIKNFKNKENGLKPIHVERFGDMVFLNLSKTIDNPFESFTKPLKDSLIKYGYEPDSSNLAFLARREYKLHANWKLYIENFCDGGYHIPYLHESMKGWDYASTDKVDLYDKVIMQITEYKTPEGMIKGGVYGYLYPNVTFAVFEENCRVVFVKPISPSLTKIIIYIYMNKEFNDNQKKCRTP